MSNPPAEQPIPGDNRSPADRATDETVAALFRESGMALSNGHTPAIQGADARARAAEEDALSALFVNADRLQTSPGPDFRQMAAKAREIARQRGEANQDDEVVGEMTRSDLQQLPDLEVRCWNVSQTASLPLETSAASETPVAVASAPVPAIAPRGSARAAVPLTAHDAANIRENNWSEFKKRYHAERRGRILEMAAAGAFGAAACFLLVWAGGFLTIVRPGTPGSPLPVSTADKRGMPGMDRTSHAAASSRDVRRASAPEIDSNENEMVPVDRDSIVGAEEWDWIARNRQALDLPSPSDKLLINGPTFFAPKVEPNPRRKLGELFQPRVAGDNAWPELYPEHNQGLRIIRLSPRSDCAQALLAVNDWIVRVIQPDGTAIDLSQGNEAALQAWRDFLAQQKPGQEFDVEYVRGPLIRRTTVTLASDAPAAHAAPAAE